MGGTAPPQMLHELAKSVGLPPTELHRNLQNLWGAPPPQILQEHAKDRGSAAPHRFCRNLENLWEPGGRQGAASFVPERAVYFAQGVRANPLDEVDHHPGSIGEKMAPHGGPDMAL